MERLKTIWESITAFLATHDLQKVSSLLKALEWQDLLQHPAYGVAGLVLIAYLVVKKRLKTIMVLCSLLLFLALLQHTVPAPGESVPLSRLLTFVGGSALIAGVNLYFLLIRGD